MSSSQPSHAVPSQNMGPVSLLLLSRLANSRNAEGLNLLLDQLRNLKYDFKKIIAKIRCEI